VYADVSLFSGPAYPFVPPLETRLTFLLIWPSTTNAVLYQANLWGSAVHVCPGNAGNLWQLSQTVDDPAEKLVRVRTRSGSSSDNYSRHFVCIVLLYCIVLFQLVATLFMSKLSLQLYNRNRNRDRDRTPHTTHHTPHTTHHTPHATHHTPHTTHHTPQDLLVRARDAEPENWNFDNEVDH
jgi:hypothetical protein